MPFKMFSLVDLDLCHLKCLLAMCFSYILIVYREVLYAFSDISITYKKKKLHIYFFISKQQEQLILEKSNNMFIATNEGCVEKPESNVFREANSIAPSSYRLFLALKCFVIVSNCIFHERLWSLQHQNIYPNKLLRSKKTKVQRPGATNNIKVNDLLLSPFTHIAVTINRVLFMWIKIL